MPATGMPLLWQAIEWIERNPHRHEQCEWAVRRSEVQTQGLAKNTGQPVHECRTAYCLAGVIVVLHDGEDAILFHQDEVDILEEESVTSWTLWSDSIRQRAEELILPPEDLQSFLPRWDHAASQVVQLWNANSTVEQIQEAATELEQYLSEVGQG